MPNLNLTDTPATDLDVDALVIGVTTGDDGPRLAPGAETVDAAFGGRLAATLRTVGASGKAEEVTKVPSGGAVRAPLVVAVGLGDAPGNEVGYQAETLRRAAGAAVRALAGTAGVGLALPDPAGPDEVECLAQGALLGAYSFLRYRDTSGDALQAPVERIELACPSGIDESIEAATRRARTLAEAVGLARDLVNTPPSDLHPQEFADIAASTAAATGLGIEVLDETALREQGYGGMIGVGQGSVNPPRLVRLSYTHPEATRTIAFVGKGITFDSGGLSLKPAASMEWMKSDMGGAAAVLGAVSAIARVAPAVNVVAYLCLAENMPSGSAQRPSDVLTMYGGRTVEVLNTDAEGRLVLADAIVRASRESEVVVDAATLTGAQIVALGKRVAGAMGNDDGLREAVVDAANRAGDSAWPMPLPHEVRKTLDSSVADIANSGERVASMLQAAIFLREFVPEGVRWAHLDIAGPAYNTGEPYGYTPKGGTGAATRALVTIAEDAAAGKL